jgi:DinB superfamily
MIESERAFVVSYLEQTRDRVLALARSLTPEQRGLRRSDDEWCAADLIEHIVVVEQWSLDNIERTLRDGHTDESRRGKGAHKDAIILHVLPARNTRVQAPAQFQPTNRWPDWDDLVGQFSETRARVVDLAQTTQADLRIHFMPHPFLKDLDCYQWLVLIASHAERHMRQAEETLIQRASA